MFAFSMGTHVEEGRVVEQCGNFASLSTNFDATVPLILEGVLVIFLSDADSR